MGEYTKSAAISNGAKPLLEVCVAKGQVWL
jgi:hypothetical protein